MESDRNVHLSRLQTTQSTDVVVTLITHAIPKEKHEARRDCQSHVVELSSDGLTDWLQTKQLIIETSINEKFGRGPK